MTRTPLWVSGVRFLFFATTAISLVLFGTTVAFSGDLSAGPATVTPRVTAITQISKDGFAKTGLLADGANIYVTESAGARRVIAKMALDSAKRALLPNSLLNIQALDVSPDGKNLLVQGSESSTGESEFWLVPLAGGTPQNLHLSGRDAAWSPDGTQLVLSRDESLYLAKGDGTGERKLFTSEGSVFAPRISPDGKVVRFTVSDLAQNRTSLWEVNIDGSKAHALLDGWTIASAACCGRWTSDGRYYVFQVTQGSPALTTLWAVSSGAPDAVPVQLTTGPISLAKVTASTDPAKMWAIGVSPAGEAVRFDPAHKAIVPLLNGISATDLDYTADGKWVTYCSVPDGTLWRSKADGSARLQLTASGEHTALPKWSPDGKRIAFVSLPAGRPAKILIISRDGGPAQEVAADDHGQIDANWSADGTRLMFGYFYAEHLNIKIADLKTHTLTAIPGSEDLFSPRWSPDGRYIAALSHDFTTVKLFDNQTQQWSTWFSEPAGAVSYPVWSPDSKRLFFDDLVTAEESIRTVELGKHTPDVVFVLGGIDRYTGPFGLWFGRMPDGSFMFIRDHSAQEVYQLSMQLP